MNTLQAAKGVLVQVLNAGGHKWSPELVEHGATLVDLCAQIAARELSGMDTGDAAKQVESGMRLLIAAAGNLATAIIFDAAAQAVRLVLQRVVGLPLAK